MTHPLAWPFLAAGLILQAALPTTLWAGQAFPYPGFPLDKIGHAIDFTTGEIGEWCAKGDVHFYPQPRLLMKLHYNQAELDLYQNLHGHLGHGVNLGIIGYKQTVNFVHNYSKTNKREAMVYELDARHGIFKIKAPQRVAEGSCQLGYAEGAAVGSKLLIAIAAEFATVDEYKEFRATTKVSGFWGLGKGKRVDIKRLKKALGYGSIKVRSLLLGATSPKLSQMAAERSCTRANLEECLDYAHGVMAAFTRSNEFYDAVKGDLDEGRHFVQEVIMGR